MELRPTTLTKAGLWIIGTGWAPVIVIGLMDPISHPTGLAIIAWAGTMIGLGVFFTGCGMWLFHHVGRKHRRRKILSNHRRRRA
jgi:hypothetical protein